MQKNYKVYMHKNKVNGKVYIGQTSRELHRRWDNGNGYKKCTLFNRAIQKYGWDNFDHILLDENLTKEEADIKEREYIKKYKSYIPQFGYNISMGGAGLTGATKYIDIYKYSLDGDYICHYHDIAEIIEENPTYSSSALRHAYDEECRSVYGYQWKSYYQPKIDKLDDFAVRVGQIKSKKVYQYDIYGNFIREHPSAKIAGENCNLNSNSIRKHSKKNVYHYYGGYQWSYEFVDNIGVADLYYIYKYDKNTGILLDKYKTIDSAAKSNDVKESCLCNCLSGNAKSIGGFIWKKYHILENPPSKIDITHKK